VSVLIGNGNERSRRADFATASVRGGWRGRRRSRWPQDLVVANYGPTPCPSADNGGAVPQGQLSRDSIPMRGVGTQCDGCGRVVATGLQHLVGAARTAVETSRRRERSPQAAVVGWSSRLNGDGGRTSRWRTTAHHGLGAAGQRRRDVPAALGYGVSYGVGTNPHPSALALNAMASWSGDRQRGSDTIRCCWHRRRGFRRRHVRRGGGPVSVPCRLRWRRNLDVASPITKWLPSYVCNTTSNVVSILWATRWHLPATEIFRGGRWPNSVASATSTGRRLDLRWHYGVTTARAVNLTQWQHRLVLLNAQSYLRPRDFTAGPLGVRHRRDSTRWQAGSRVAITGATAAILGSVCWARNGRSRLR